MSGRKVADIQASRRIVRLAAGDSVREASRLMARERVGAVLVTDGDRLEGIFTERDALNRVIATARDPEHTTLAEVMTAEPATVSPQSTAVEALRLMRDGGFRHLPVVDQGRLVGVISLRDFIGAELAAVERDAQVSALLGGEPRREP